MSDAFEDTIYIIVNLTNGFGSYEYQLDGSSFQTNNVFSNVDSGEHVITIKDIKGNCDDPILIAKVLKYPNFPLQTLMDTTIPGIFRILLFSLMPISISWIAIVNS